MIILPGKSVAFKTYRETITGLRINAYNSEAMIDNCPSITAYADDAHEINIYDSSGNILNGILKSVGTGESLSSELLLDTTYDDASKWSVLSGWSISGGKAIATAATTGLVTVAAAVEHQYRLVKFVYTCDTYSSGNFGGRIGGETTYYPPHASTGTYTDYITKRDATSNAVGVRYYDSALTASFTQISVKYSILPSTNGIRIVSAKGGTTYNFASRSASFALNEASYDVEIKRI